MFKSYSMELGGRTLTLEFGKYAEQASGATFVPTSCQVAISAPAPATASTSASTSVRILEIFFMAVSSFYLFCF